MEKNLLVITTAGTLEWLKKAIATLQDPLKVLVVDDATPDKVGIKDFCKKKNIAFLTKPKPKGLTNSWNMAYNYFRKNNYQNCILSNDDVKFPLNFSQGLLKGLQKFDLVGPLSNKPGTGHHQQIKNFTDIEPDEKNINQTQKAIWKKYQKTPFIQDKFVNGFCFTFSSSIKKFAFNKQFLFNPININTKNEYDLAGRISKRGGKIAICKTSYVFHRKQGTYKGLKLKNRNQLWR